MTVLTRKTFTLTEEQFSRLCRASKPVPYMVFGGRPPSSPQNNANAAWRALGEELGFDWETVQPVAGNDHQFTARVLERTDP